MQHPPSADIRRVNDADHPVVASRRRFIAAAGSSVLAARPASVFASSLEARVPAQIAITFDLEMSRHYPRRGMTEWDYQKGNLDGPTIDYTRRVGEFVASRGFPVHFFCVGRVLEQPDVSWLVELAEQGHAVGNHTYDHVNVLATTTDAVQFRFQRAPWLIGDRTASELIRDNIALTSEALRTRCDLGVNGFRTPGGFHDGLASRVDVQRMLRELGFEWVSSRYPRHDSGQPGSAPDERVMRDIVRAQQHAQPYRYPTGLIEVPMSPISDVTAFRAHRWSLEAFLAAVRRAVLWAIEGGQVFDFLAHPSCLVVEDPELQAVQLICRLVEEAGPNRAQIVTLDEIARRAA